MTVLNVCIFRIPTEQQLLNSSTSHYWEPVNQEKCKFKIFIILLRSVVIIYLSFILLITRKIASFTVKRSFSRLHSMAKEGMLKYRYVTYALTLKAGVMRNSILLLCIWETQGNNICNVTKFASCQIVQIFHARADARNRKWNFTSFIYYNISNMHASMYINWLKGLWKILNKGLNFIRVITRTRYLCITWPRCQCVNSYGTIT